MKKLIFILSFLLPYATLAQTNLVFDLSVNEFSPALATLPTNGPINITYLHPEVLGSQHMLDYQITDANGRTYDHSWSVNNPFSIDPAVQLRGFTGDLKITISQQIGNSLKLLKQFVIQANGSQVTNVKNQTRHVYFNMHPAPAIMAKPAGYDNYKVVVYDPCLNSYQIFNKGHLRNALWFRPYNKNVEQHGVLFLINNFNPLKYAVTVSSTFANRFNTVPDLFTSELNLLATGAAAAGNAPTLPTEIAKIMQMNTDLKSVINLDCADFGLIKNDIQNNALLNFGANGMVSIDLVYNTLKQADIAARQAGLPAGTKYGVPEFNAAYQTNWHLPVSPDSLVKETISLYNLIMVTDFRYQSNIIQLQNADEIDYTLTFAPQPNAKNTTININAQPLAIPVLGGIKVDFSTGLFYSNVKNEVFALRKNTMTDTAKNDIINESNYNGRTLGVTALAHIYPRLLTGINPTLTVGLGKSLDMNYAILLGGSALLGRQNHFAVSAGMNFANIKMLSNAYMNPSGQRIPQPVSLTTVNTYNGFKRGFFLSFTYAFGSASAAAQTASAASAAAAPAAATPAATGKSK